MKIALRLFPAGMLIAVSLWAQESEIGAEFRGERERFSESCGSFKIIGCGTLLFTDHPLHIGAGSIAPQNGFAAGPAFSFEHHTAPRQKPNAAPGEVGSRWRLNWNVDAVASGNQSWRAGAYMTAMFIPGRTISVVQGVPPPNRTDLTRTSPVIHAYAQSESLNKLLFYGEGQGSSRGAQSFFGMRETIAGVNVLWPIVQRISLSVFAEANARTVSLRPYQTADGPSIYDRYAEATAPGLANQPAFGQFGQGIRLDPSLLGNHVKLNYSATFQEFAAPGSKYSFRRLLLDFSHEFPLYGTSTGTAPRQFNGPDSCALSESSATCPAPESPKLRLTKSSDRQGSITLRFLLTDSFVGTGNSIPFYFQPTLGGSDINGQLFLPSYADYRFRAPNLMVFRESFEHSIWGPIGLVFTADQGKVAATRGDIGFDHLAHSFATGITLRAGGFPAVSLMFAWGGREGTHNLALVSPSLLGGGSRPTL
jgi:hypothetical protein